VQTVTLVEINVYDGLVPLVSGYLQTYACTSAAVRENYQFRKRSYSRTADPDQIYQNLVDVKSHIYGFSCYIWNMRLVRTLVRRLREDQPRAWILLGGPQVMGHAQRYLDSTDERILVCNGEGEEPFKKVLEELNKPRPNISAVPSLSYFCEGRLYTTKPASRIKDLDEIPSPFLADVYDQEYTGAVLETNRGCPFHCGFCFWGAATNDKVHRFGEDRVRADIEWIARNNTPFIFIADANWGMLKRDIELSQHIVDCKARYGSPAYVYFSAAKNSPDRVSEITDIFKSAGLFTSQPVSMQSVDERTLELIDRKNIKISAYESLQQNLNKKGIGSFIELIWPLPGETLASFQKGIEKLCTKGAKCLIVYPHLLLHNTPIYEQREAHGVVIRDVDDPAAEAEIVVQTTDVSRAEFTKGLWFIYSVLAIHNANSLPSLARYLHETDQQPYAEFYAAFSSFCEASNDSTIADFCRSSIEDARYYDVFNYPTVYFYALHEHRSDFDRLLSGFAHTQPWWTDSTARALFEADMLSRPFIYRNTPFDPPATEFTEFNLLESADRSHIVELNPKHTVALSTYGSQGINSAVKDPATQIVQIDHKKSRHPYQPNQPTKSYADYCSGAIMRIDSLMGSWSALEI
jgi:radical SAM superfamily enzyme YgiQ (UPF0313 family)